METDYTINEKSKRLTRSNKNRILFGICGGLAEYFKISSVIFRALFLVFLLSDFFSAILYIILIFVIASESNETITDEEINRISYEKKLFYGVAIIIGGLYFLNDDFDIFSVWNIFHHWHFFDFGFVPVLLILGTIILVINLKGDKKMNEQGFKKLYLSNDDRKILGICGGLGEYFSIDPTLIRILWIGLTLFSGFFPGVLLYFILKLIVPSKPKNFN